MARSFEVGPGTYVFGNVTVQVGYQRDDHTQMVWLVTASGSQAQTEGVQPRGGNPNQMVVLSAVNVTDQQAVGAQQAQGGPVGSSVTPRGGGISGTGTPF